MANHKSAIKRHKQSLKKRIRNRTVKASTRTAVKNFEKSLKASGEQSVDPKQLFVLAEKKLQSAASKGVINRKAAGRKIARLAKTFKAQVDQANS